MQQPWDARQQVAGFADAPGRAFELPGRTEMARDPFPHDRLGGGPDIKPGIERAPHAFDHHHGLLQHQEFRPGAHVEQAGHFEQKREQLRHRDVFGGTIVDRLADRPDRLSEAFNRMMRRYVAGLEMHFGGAAIVAGDEAEQNFRQEPPFLGPQPSHDAEVDRD